MSAQANASAPLQNAGFKLILASASASRAAVLKAAGLKFDTVPADIDEDSVREALTVNGASPEPADVAEILARAKAETVSESHPEALVIGADQVLALGREIFAKPSSMAAARAGLLRLRGRSHRLHGCVCVAKDGETVWSHLDTATLTMRDFTPEFLGRYLAQAGEQVLQSVGAYQLEGLGAHLFNAVKGDYFTVLGLPLFPLLDYLRKDGVIGS